MSELDNPAGRLHALLLSFTLHANNQSVSATWAQTLDVPEAEVPFRLGAVGALLLEVRRRIEDEETDAYEPLVAQLAPMSRCIFPPNQSLADPAPKVVPNGSAMHLLRAYSLHLHMHDPEGVVPSTDELSELREGLRDLQDSVRESDLSSEVKRAVLKRLAQMLHALDEVAVGGPGGIREAVDALVGALVVAGPHSGLDKSLARKAGRFVTRALAALALSDAATGHALGLGEHVNKLLDMAAARPQLPPGGHSHEQESDQPGAEPSEEDQ